MKRSYLILFLMFMISVTQSHGQIKTLIPASDTEVVVIPHSDYVTPGSTYHVDIYLPPYDSAATAEVIINGTLLKVEQGKATYTTFYLSKKGPMKWSGKAVIKKDGKIIKEINIPEHKYWLATNEANVQATKMNVFYIGLDNPVWISIPGYNPEQIHVVADNATITGSRGNYTVRTDKPGMVNINVSVDNEQGNAQIVSTAQFRSKRLPTPTVHFAGRDGGYAPAALIKAQNKLFSFIPELDFEAHFTIKHFTLVIYTPGKGSLQKLEANSAELTPEMMAALKDINTGHMIIFSDIKADGPDGITRNLYPLTFFID